MALIRALFPEIRAISNFRKGAGVTSPLQIHLICNTLKKGPLGKSTEDFLNTLKTAF